MDRGKVSRTRLDHFFQQMPHLRTFRSPPTPRAKAKDLFDQFCPALGACRRRIQHFGGFPRLPTHPGSGAPPTESVRERLFNHGQCLQPGPDALHPLGASSPVHPFSSYVRVDYQDRLGLASFGRKQRQRFTITLWTRFGQSLVNSPCHSSDGSGVFRASNGAGSSAEKQRV